MDTIRRHRVSESFKTISPEAVIRLRRMFGGGRPKPVRRAMPLFEHHVPLVEEPPTSVGFARLLPK
ncbi:MAG: hypothetical protein JWO52_4651 [Gammaproteobacteria bacterium]|nr:hypothetical protein [Gammaproteobacteria bacterium]